MSGVADLSDEELMLLAHGPEDNLAKQRSRAGRTRPDPHASDLGGIPDEELLAIAKGGDVPRATPRPPAYQPTDYSGGDPTAGLGPSTDANLEGTARARVFGDPKGGGDIDMDAARGRGATFEDLRRVSPRTSDVLNANSPDVEAHDAARGFLGVAAGGLAGMGASQLAGALVPMRAAPLVGGVAGGIAGGGTQAAVEGREPRDIIEAMALGGLLGGATGMRPQEGSPVGPARSQAEMDVAALRGAPPEPPDLPEGSHGTVALAERANNAIDASQAAEEQRLGGRARDVEGAWRDATATRRRELVDREASVRSGAAARARTGEENWRAAIEDKNATIGREMDAADAAAAQLPPVDTSGARARIRAIQQDSLVGGNPVLSSDPVLRDYLDNLTTPAERPDGTKVRESVAPMKDLITARKALNERAYKERATGATLSEGALKQAAGVVSDVSAPPGSDYRAALDKYGQGKDYVDEVTAALGPEGSFEPYVNPDAPNELNRATSETKALADSLGPEGSFKPRDTRAEQIDTLRGGPGSRVTKLAGVGTADQESPPAQIKAERDIAELGRLEPAADELTAMIRARNIKDRRGLQMPSYLGGSPTMGGLRAVRANLGNLAFKLAPPMVDATGNVHAPTGPGIDPRLPIEIQLLLQSQEDHRHESP